MPEPPSTCCQSATTITHEMKWGRYTTLWMTRRTFVLRSPWSVSARAQIGAGK